MIPAHLGLRLLLGGALFLSLTIALPWQARAEGVVKVTVHVIHASKKPGEVDPRLEGLKKELAAFAFKAYSLHQVQALRLKVGQTGEVKLPEAKVLKVTAISRDAKGRLKVRLAIEKVVDATYVIDNGGTMIIGGARHGEGTQILAVTQTTG